MLNTDKINKIAQDAAAANLTSSAISRVFSEDAIDSQGKDALRITIVINPDSIGKLTGDAVVDTLVGIRDRLRQAAEERFPIVEYSTEEELQESGVIRITCSSRRTDSRFRLVPAQYDRWM